MALSEGRRRRPESKGSLEWFVYILKMKDGRLYTGITPDPESRFARHRAGDGSRTTKARGAAKVIYTEVHDSRASAARRERQIKRWTRAKKLALANGDPAELKRLSRSRSKRSQ